MRANAHSFIRLGTVGVADGIDNERINNIPNSATRTVVSVLSLVLNSRLNGRRIAFQTACIGSRWATSADTLKRTSDRETGQLDILLVHRIHLQFECGSSARGSGDTDRPFRGESVPGGRGTLAASATSGKSTALLRGDGGDGTSCASSY